jgi:hypothetical protein
MKHRHSQPVAPVALALLCGTLSMGASSAHPATPSSDFPPTIVSGAGDVLPLVEKYRALRGDPDNGSAIGSQPAGRRELNWDSIPDEFAAPNLLPPDFFNATVGTRVRGARLTSPGTGVQVSADSDNPWGAPVRFGHINPDYSAIFQTFSQERLFSPIGSNIVDLTFFIPGTQTPALVRGFGALYTDIDTEHTAFEYFDRNNQSLGKFAVPIASNGLSFLGVAFDQPIVARVRIQYGTAPLGPNDGPDNDVAVMDDFIYGEPKAAP